MFTAAAQKLGGLVSAEFESARGTHETRPANGACDDHSGSSSKNPSVGRRHGASRPKLTLARNRNETRDQAKKFESGIVVVLQTVPRGNDGRKEWGRAAGRLPRGPYKNAAALF